MVQEIVLAVVPSTVIREDNRARVRYAGFLNGPDAKRVETERPPRRATRRNWWE